MRRYTTCDRAKRFSRHFETHSITQYQFFLIFIWLLLWLGLQLSYQLNIHFDWISIHSEIFMRRFLMFWIISKLNDALRILHWVYLFIYFTSQTIHLHLDFILKSFRIWFVVLFFDGRQWQRYAVYCQMRLKLSTDSFKKLERPEIFVFFFNGVRRVCRLISWVRQRYRLWGTYRFLSLESFLFCVRNSLTTRAYLFIKVSPNRASYNSN